MFNYLKNILHLSTQAPYTGLLWTTNFLIGAIVDTTRKYDS